MLFSLKSFCFFFFIIIIISILWMVQEKNSKDSILKMQNNNNSLKKAGRHYGPPSSTGSQSHMHHLCQHSHKEKKDMKRNLEQRDSASNQKPATSIIYTTHAIFLGVTHYLDMETTYFAACSPPYGSSSNLMVLVGEIALLSNLTFIASKRVVL